MKGSTAWAHWKNAVEGLESAEILLNHGKYKRSVAEAYYAIETAARASLAEKNVDPRTRKGVWKALNNKLIQSGELPAETADYLARERVKRGAAEYIPLSSGSDEEAREACSRGAAVLETVRNYLLNRGYTKDDLPEPERYRKAVTRGGDPGISLPSGGQKGGEPTPGDGNRGPTW